jgi:hypothetical protein
VPIYAKQFVGELSGWSTAVVDSMATVLSVVKQDYRETASKGTEVGVSTERSGYAQLGQWARPFEAAWPDAFAVFNVSSQEHLSGEQESKETKRVDLFSAATFLDSLRRSNNSSIVFVQPHSLFPISSYTVSGSQHGSYVPSSARHGYVGAKPSASENDRFLLPFPLVQAALPDALEPEVAAAVPE